MFELAALERHLTGSIFAGKLHFAPVTPSTNGDAMAGARAGAAHGSVWLADEQTAGRGRGDHRWHSAAGEGLYVSVLLRPAVPATHLPLLPLAAGLAAANAIRSVAGIAVDLRWPNDLLIGDRKAGGILAESAQGASDISVVVGIGINVHQREFAADLATPATSLDCESGQRVSRQALLVALLKSLEHETRGLADGDAAQQICGRVQAGSSWVRGRAVEVHGPQACSGVTAGLDENGFLRVATPAGEVTVRTGGIRQKITAGL